MGNAPDKSNAGIREVVLAVLRDFWPLLVASGLFVAVQWPVLKNWWAVWNENESYYSHGVLVPFIAGFMLWVNRASLAKAMIRPTWIGLALLTISVPVHLVGLITELRIVYGIAFLMCVFAIILALLGWRIARIAFVPVMFLSTMMPVASWMLDGATARFQLVSASIATKFLQLTSGYEVVQRGNEIQSAGLPGDTLLVGSPCSGLRLLISLVTFCWFFIYVTKGAWWKKTTLMAMSFPLSIFINSLRITMIAYVGFWTGSSEAMHSFHDYSGYIGLVICFLILFGTARLLKAGEISTGLTSPANVSSPIVRLPRLVGGGLHGALVVAVLAAVAVASNSAKPLYDLPQGHIDKSSIPRSFGTWNSTELSIDKVTRDALSAGYLLSLMYVDNGETGRSVQVFISASHDISAFHDPHHCLPGGGSPITEDRPIDFAFKQPRPLSVRATRLQASGQYGESLLIYWYMIGDRSMPRTEDVFQLNRQYRASDLKRVILSPWTLPQLREDVKSRQFIWYRFSTDSLDESTDERFLKEFIRQFVSNTDGFGRF